MDANIVDPPILRPGHLAAYVAALLWVGAVLAASRPPADQLRVPDYADKTGQVHRSADRARAGSGRCAPASGPRDQWRDGERVSRLTRRGVQVAAVQVPARPGRERPDHTVLAGSLP